MASLLQYTDKSKTIDNKLSLILSNIEYDYNNGNIRTETEYYYRIKNAISQFYNSLNKPSFTYRPATFVPVSKDYNSMINEAYLDMQYIIYDCKELTENIEQSFEDAELSRNMMLNEIKYLTQEVDNVAQNIKLNKASNAVVFTELFNNNKIMGNYSDSSACRIHTNDGILTLPCTVADKANVLNIQIDSNISNGFPGNSHCIDTINNELHFVGQNGLHNDIRVLIDENTDTWFEYELFDISDTVRQQCNNFGFTYKEGPSWVKTHDDPLILKLIITVDPSKVCSWISLKPYLSDIKGIKNCKIQQCDIITSDNNVYNVADNIYFDETMILTFPAKPVQRIELTLVQDAWYIADVCHFYFSKTNTKLMSIFQDYDTTDIYSRIEGDNKSVNLLNCKYNPTTQWLDYNDFYSEYIDETYAKDKLFCMPNSSLTIKAGQEIVEAYRYMIGISNIAVRNQIYSDHGEYVSNVFVTEKPIDSVVLETQEYIPGNDPEILRYFITFDGGINWHKIYPIHRSYGGIYRYTINNDSISNLMTTTGKDKKSKNLNLLLDTYKIQLKIEMDAPEMDNKEYNTPIVYQYKLILETGGENIEY